MSTVIYSVESACVKNNISYAGRTFKKINCCLERLTSCLKALPQRLHSNPSTSLRSCGNSNFLKRATSFALQEFGMEILKDGRLKKNNEIDSLPIASSLDVCNSKDYLQKCNLLFDEYYSEDVILTDIETPYIGNDGHVYDVSTVSQLNGKNPFKQKLLVREDRTFKEAAEQREKTGFASKMLEDAITKEPLIDPVITIDGRRINRSTLKTFKNPKAIALSNDFRLFSLLKEAGLSSISKQEKLPQQKFEKVLNCIRNTNLTEVEKEFLKLAEKPKSSSNELKNRQQQLRLKGDKLSTEVSELFVENSNRPPPATADEALEQLSKFMIDFFEIENSRFENYSQRLDCLER